MLTIFAGLIYCLALGTWTQWPWWLNLVLGIILGGAVRQNAYTVSHPLSGIYLFSLPFHFLHWPIWIGIVWGAVVGISAGYREAKRHIMQQKLEFYERAQHDNGRGTRSTAGASKKSDIFRDRSTV